MDYRKLVETIPVAKLSLLSGKLVELVLTSKNDEKMPCQMANTILHYWQHGVLTSESGLAALLEAAVLLEPDRTVNAFNELQMPDKAEQIKESVKT